MPGIDPLDHRGYAAAFARRFCRRYPHLTRADVEDATQEALMSIMSASVAWDGERPWLPLAAASIRRALTRWVRGTGVVPLPVNHPDLPAGSVGWDDAAPAPAEFTEIRDAVNSLPEELRVIIVGLHFGGYKTHELAETLGITRRTIHRREQAAFALLRESLT